MRPKVLPSHGNRLVGVVGDLHLDAKGRVTLLLLHVEQCVAREVRQLRLDRADRAERAHLGHAPGVEHLHAVVFFEGLDHGARASRAADHDAVQIRELAAGLFQMLQQHSQTVGTAPVQVTLNSLSSS